MSDNFQGHQRSLESPGDRHKLIVPSDANPVVPRPRALWCAAEGTVSVEDRDGVALTYTLVAGQVLPFRAVKVRATGTTATVYGWD